MSEPRAARTLDDWCDLYEEVEPTYVAFALRLRQLLDDLLEDQEVPHEFVSDWSMTTYTFEDRLVARFRAGKQSVDPFATTGNLAEVKVIVRAPADLDAVSSLVEREFEVDLDLSIDRAEAERLTAEPDARGRIAYEHPRLVISVGADRRGLPEWERFDGMKAQISILTTLQDTWDTLFESRPFTSDAYHPASYRAALYEVAAALARADEHLSGVEPALDGAYDDAHQAVEEGRLDATLDAASLAAYLLKSARVAELVAVAERAGMTADEYPDGVSRHEDHLWTLGTLGIETVAGLDALLESGEPRADEILEAVTSVSTEQGWVPIATAEDVVSCLASVLLRADADIVTLSRWRDEIAVALDTVIGNPLDGGGEP